MKKQLTLVFACAVMLFAFACKNTSTPEPEDATPKKIKVPVKITYSRKLQPGEPGFGNTSDGYQYSFTYFSYNDQKQLINRKAANEETIFWYDEKGRVNRLTQITGSSNSETIIIYDGERVKTVMAKTYAGGILRFDYVYTYVYSDDHKLMEIAHRWDGKLAGVYRFTYTGANPTKLIVTEVSSPIEQDFTYDDKKTPFDNLSIKYVLSLPINPPFLNNTLKRSLKFTGTNISNASTNVFTYDADGFPITQVSTATNSQSSTSSETRSTIEYTEL